MVPPKDTTPPPPRPEPAVTVTEEFWRLVLVMTPAVVSEPIERPPESESVVPCPFVKPKFWRVELAVVEVA
jgi:hypothetical protein